MNLLSFNTWTVTTEPVEDHFKASVMLIFIFNMYACSAPHNQNELSDNLSFLWFFSWLGDCVVAVLKKIVPEN